MSETCSMLNENKRIIFQNPDGSYSHCLKEGEVEYSYEKPKQPAVERNNYNYDNMTVSDIDLQTLLDNTSNLNINTLLDEVLNVFRKYRILLFVLLFLEMALSLFLCFIVWKRREHSIYVIEKVYRDINSFESSICFFIIFLTNLLINFFFYPIGYIAIVYKNIKLMRFFSFFALYSAIGCIILIYVHVLYIFIFGLRLVLYGFAKFLINLLTSIILLPRASRLNQDHDRYDTFENP